MGHNSIIIGLTDTEFEKLDRKGIQEIIDFGTECLGKIDRIEF